MAKIISGTKIAAEIQEELRKRAKHLKERGIIPKLGVVLVGENPASISYVSAKSKASEKVGICSNVVKLPEDVKEENVLETVAKMNEDPDFNGILVQLPLPKQINESKVLNTILPEKDVDGLHPLNMGKLLLGEPNFIPCTPYGIYQMLVRSGYSFEGKHVVICGASNIVGKPLAALLSEENSAGATVTLCHIKTQNLARHTRQADILVSAMGIPLAITANMVKEGAVVVDVGMNRISDFSKKKGFRLVGDVDFDAVKEKASAITPVPGGVGPMTVTMLLWNTIKAAEKGSQNSGVRICI